MAFRYINPGYFNLFDALPSKNINYNYNNTTYAPKTGKSFSCEDVPLLNIPSGTKEIWGKFGLYGIYGSNINNQYFMAKSANHQVDFRYLRNCYLYVDNTQKELAFQRTTNTYRTYWFHVKSDSTNGLVECYIDGEEALTYSGNILGGEDITTVGCSSVVGNGNAWISNIIIADEEISFTENVVKVTTSIQATMTNNGDGSYSGNAVGEYLKMTPNVSSLNTEYPHGATITGYEIIGNPAYYDGDSLSKINVIVNDSALEEKTLSASTSGIIFTGANTSATIGSFAGRTYGFQVKE